jgi:hypothetical protein
MNDGEFKMRVLEDLAVIKTMARQTDKDVLQLQKTIYGNGSMGVRTQVIILWGAFIVVGGALIKVAFK